VQRRALLLNTTSSDHLFMPPSPRQGKLTYGTREKSLQARERILSAPGSRFQHLHSLGLFPFPLLPHLGDLPLPAHLLLKIAQIDDVPPCTFRVQLASEKGLLASDKEAEHAFLSCLPRGRKPSLGSRTRVANRKTILAPGKRMARAGKEEAEHVLSCRSPGGLVTSLAVKISGAQFLETVFQWLRLYRALPHDRLRVFSCSSPGELNEQLGRENQGLQFTSVTAAQFLQERRLCSPEVLQRASECQGATSQEKTPSAVPIQPAVSESGRGGNIPDGRSIGALERRCLELESGAGGDQDRPYRFTLLKLLASVQNGALQP